MSIIQNLIKQIFEDRLWENPELLKRNEALVNVGEISTDLFYVKSGALTITTEIEKKEQIIRFAYKDSVFVTIDSLLNNQPTIYNIKAIKQSEILRISKEKLQPFFSKQPEIYSELLKELIRQLADRELDLLHTNAIQRFERLLKRSPRLFQEVPHKYIASYLRISPETFSRLLKS